MATEDRNKEVTTQGECTDCPPQERSFDAVARGLANGSITRGRALRLLGGALLGGAVASIPGVGWLAGGSGEAHAQVPGDGPGGSTCSNGGQSCTAQKCCEGLSCLADLTSSTEKFCCPASSLTVCGSKCCPTGALLGCTAGKCQCPPLEIVCPDEGNLLAGKCVNLLEDPDNCSGCGLSDPKFKCPPPTGKDAPCRVRACVNGTCTTRPNISADGDPCNADDNKCTENDSCLAGFCTPGTLKTCPASQNPCARLVCNPVTGDCEPQPANAGAVCRPAQGECDSPALCTGASIECPDNPLKELGTVCRPAADACDVPEFCTGTSAQCPENEFAPEGTICLASRGECEAAGTCNGSGQCRDRVFLTTVCRPAANECDVPEFCTGDSPTCPQDTFVDNGTPCDRDENLCTLDTCQNGVCRAGSQKTCPVNTTACKVNICDPTTGDCVEQNAPDSTTCSTDPCKTGQTCNNGTCQGGTTIAGCTNCTNNNQCGSGQTCTGGVCVCASGRRACGRLCCPDNRPTCTTTGGGNPTCS
jgi:hypothetical protein